MQTLFQTISWQQYFEFLLAGMLCYYGGILFFYRTEFLKIEPVKKFRDGRRETSQENPDFLQKEGQLSRNTANEQSGVFDAARELSEALSGIIRQAADQELPREELLFSCYRCIKKYPVLRHKAFQQSINHHIEKELEKFCSVRLHEAELSSLWVG